MPSNSRNTFFHLDERPLERTNTFRDYANGITNATYKAAASLFLTTRDAINADVPLGAWAAAAEATSKAPTLKDIRKGSFAERGWIENGLMRAGKESGDAADKGRITAHKAEGSSEQRPKHHVIKPLGATSREECGRTLSAAQDDKQFSSACVVPPTIPWTRSTVIALSTFWKWFLTPLGFLVTIYALNIVAWGGMLFLLLCNAAPEMCWAWDSREGWIRDCDNLYSSRRIWLEIDSQILNALFCITGFGLIPWRFRDLYYLLRWRLLSEKKYGRHQKLYGLRTLGGIYKSWVRIPGSCTLDTMSLEEYNAMAFPSAASGLTEYEVNLPSVKAIALDPLVPWKLSKTPSPPLTGIRAPPTALWKIDVFVWCNVWNTFFQAFLCGFMWGMSRFDRPSWSTGLFIALACIVSGVGGVISFNEGKRIKRIEGISQVPERAEELSRLCSIEGSEFHEAEMWRDAGNAV